MQQEEETFYKKEKSPVTHVQASLWAIYTNTAAKVQVDMLFYLHMLLQNDKPGYV